VLCPSPGTSRIRWTLLIILYHANAGAKFPLKQVRDAVTAAQKRSKPGKVLLEG
jgi:hypothetical protein